MKETNVNQTTIADFGKTISALHFSIDSTKKSIQEELDDHRVAIDLQTEDIEKVFVGLNEVDSKVEGVVEKLNARIDKLQMMLAQALMRSMLHVQLSKGEQYVFAVLEKSNVATSVLDVARTLARRAERRVVAVKEEGKVSVGEHSLAYLNRLSSLLYAMARLVNQEAGVKEEAPKY